MAVSENGQWTGYLSGGCLEQAIALEAVDAIKAEKPRLLRYGKGSAYFDIRLPCGSGLDVFILPVRDLQLIEAMRDRMERRECFALRIGLATGACSIEAASEPGAGLKSARDGKSFDRVYMPSLRCLIAGSSPIAVKLAELAACAGFETAFYVPDPRILAGVPRRGARLSSGRPAAVQRRPLDRGRARLSRPRTGASGFRGVTPGLLFLDYCDREPQRACRAQACPRGRRRFRGRYRAHSKPRGTCAGIEVRLARGSVDPGADCGRRARAAHRYLAEQPGFRRNGSNGWGFLPATPMLSWPWPGRRTSSTILTAIRARTFEKLFGPTEQDCSFCRPIAPA